MISEYEAWMQGLTSSKRVEQRSEDPCMLCKDEYALV